MGLDMKLSATKYFSKNFNGKQAEQIKKVVKEITPESPVTVKFEVGYWRKANHIHRWFVENIQEAVSSAPRHPTHRGCLAARVRHARGLQPARAATL